MALTLTDVPGAQVGAAVISGNGNTVIDPDECNSLSLVITNQTGPPMNGISARLDSADPSVIVTQPFSDYPDVPAYGRAQTHGFRAFHAAELCLRQQYHPESDRGLFQPRHLHHARRA